MTTRAGEGDRIDLRVADVFGENTDERRRDFIRWNIAQLAENPTFWLTQGNIYLTSPSCAAGGVSLAHR